MKLVIEIAEKYYIDIKESEHCGNYSVLYALDAIRNGTPLPKHHGRLIDADWVKNTLDIYVLNEYNGQFIRRSDIDSIPAIIEADGGGEDEADN